MTKELSVSAHALRFRTCFVVSRPLLSSNKFQTSSPSRSGQFLVTAARDGDYQVRNGHLHVVTKALSSFSRPILGMLFVTSIAATVMQVGLLNNEEVFNWSIR